jgi:hypothetical protein
MQDRAYISRMANDLKARQAQQVLDGKLALADYEASFRAAVDRMPHLRAARLARDAQPKPAEKKKAGRR